MLATHAGLTLRGVMKIYTTAVMIVLAGSAASAGQQKGTNGLVDRVQTKAAVEAVAAAPGSTVTLKLQITPDHGIRVYAPGAKSFTGAVVLLTPSKQLKLEKPVYALPSIESNPGNKKRVPLYNAAFNIDHVVTIDKNAKPGTAIRVFGALKYQTCDERVVYPARTLPVVWTLRISEPSESPATSSPAAAR